MTSEDRTRALLERWHAGDRAAVAELVERDRDWILGRVRQRRGPALQRDAETADHFQDLVLEVLDYAPRFVVASQAQFRRLIARMLDNLLVDRARWLERRRPLRAATLRAWSSETRLELDPPARESLGPPAQAERAEEIEWLRLAMEFLDADDRRIVHEHKLLGRTFVEIGEDLQVAPNTVRMRFNRALLRLAGVLRRLQGGQLDELLEELGPQEGPAT
jgi:RNA polymerase sigma factor (sigma-70 family)